ncbi:hypothetical protein B0H14DRAFT_2630951 [Mycena olivaceomarginata]|nr:hypothetical protein B0H14DRAFT_2630951 [Mycena olivaceomarginata]
MCRMSFEAWVAGCFACQSLGESSTHSLGLSSNLSTPCALSNIPTPSSPYLSSPRSSAHRSNPATLPSSIHPAPAPSFFLPRNPNALPEPTAVGAADSATRCVYPANDMGLSVLLYIHAPEVFARNAGYGGTCICMKSKVPLWSVRSTSAGVENHHGMATRVVVHPRGGEGGSDTEVGKERAEEQAAKEGGFALGDPAGS